MTASEWIAVLALIISSGGFAIQARNYVLSGPRPNLSIMGDAIQFPRDDGQLKLALTVINRGSATTVITHMVCFVYSSCWRRYRRKHADLAGIVNATNVPAELAVNQSWIGLMTYDERTKKARALGHLYVGVICSHADRPFLLKVRPKPQQDIPTERIKE